MPPQNHFDWFPRWLGLKLFSILFAWLLLALCLFVLSTTSFAGPPNTPLDKLCVVGRVINHDETALGAGWVITATPYDAAGKLVPEKAIRLGTDEKGRFALLNVTEPSKWKFEIQLPPDWEAVTPSVFDVELGYGRDDCAAIRFKVRRLVTVKVLKVNEQHVPLAGWKITAQPDKDNLFASPVSKTTKEDGFVTFRLSEGGWIFSESSPKGVKYDPIMPDDGTQALYVVAPGPYTLRFKNEPHYLGCVETYKYDVTPGSQQNFPLPEWRIEMRRMDGSLLVQGWTDALGKIKFINIPPGPYQVVEEQRVGWKPVGPSRYEIKVVGSSDCGRVEFFNVQDKAQFCIEGRKIDVNGKVGLPGWKITAEPLEAGGYKPASVLTDGEGNYQFVFPDDDYRIPGASYRITEETQDGWLAASATSYEVKLPKKPGACVQVKDFKNEQVGHSQKPEDKPANCRLIHTVKEGEWLSKIAVMYGVPYASLLKANPQICKRPNLYLYVGDRICIPNQ